MNTNGKKHEDIYLLFEKRVESWGSVYFTFRPVHLQDENRVVSAHVYGLPSGDLDCQGMLDTERGNVTVWDYLFHTYSVNRRSAEEYHRVLSRIGKAIDKLNAKWGIPETYGDFVIRFSDAIGAVGYLRKNKSRYEVEGYTVGDANDAKYWIKDAVFSHLNPPEVIRS